MINCSRLHSGLKGDEIQPRQPVSYSGALAGFQERTVELTASQPERRRRIAVTERRWVHEVLASFPARIYGDLSADGAPHGP